MFDELKTLCDELIARCQRYELLPADSDELASELSELTGLDEDTICTLID